MSTPPPSARIAPPAAPEPAPTFDRESERRAVMRVVLMERCAKLRHRLGRGEAKRFVLDPVLEARFFPFPSETALAALRARGRKSPVPLELADGRVIRAPVIAGLDGRSLADWAARAAPSPTPKDLDVPLPIDWFTGADWSALKGIVITGPGAFESPKWQAFHHHHPDSAGWVKLSDVGLSPNGGQALIYAAVHYGQLGAHGLWFLLEKRDGQWAIVADKLDWVS